MGVPASGSCLCQPWFGLTQRQLRLDTRVSRPLTRCMPSLRKEHRTRTTCWPPSTHFGSEAHAAYIAAALCVNADAYAGGLGKCQSRRRCSVGVPMAVVAGLRRR